MFFCYWHFLITPIFKSFYFVKWCPIFNTSSLTQFSKFNNLLWFWGKNLSNFVPPVWKLQNPCCHNQEIGLRTWLVYLQRGFQDTIMIHENDIGRVDLSPDYLTLCNRYFIRETSLRTAIWGENIFWVAYYFFCTTSYVFKRISKLWIFKFYQKFDYDAKNNN